MSAFLFLLKSFRPALTVKGHGTVGRELLGLAPKTHWSLAQLQYQKIYITARTHSLKNKHFLKVIKINHNSIYFLHLGQDYTISTEPIFLSPLKANLLIHVQVWQLQTQVPSRPTSLEKALSESIKVLRLFQSYDIINADINGMYIYVYLTLPKGKAAFPSAIYKLPILTFLTTIF